MRGAGGGLVSRKRCLRTHHPAPGAFEETVVLAPGRYRVTVETELGHRGALDFPVDALASFPDVVPIAVR